MAAPSGSRAAARGFDAGDLAPGDLVLLDDGWIAVVDDVRKRTAVQRVHNLTIEDVHTYYVAFGDEGVLVHNCGGAAANAVHGNSRQSTKLTYLYRLEDDAGNYLLTGIISNPKGRYSKAFMSDKTMHYLTSGSRSNTMDYERMIVEMDPGPLNFERWAGAAG